MAVNHSEFAYIRAIARPAHRAADGVKLEASEVRLLTDRDAVAARGLDGEQKPGAAAASAGGIEGETTKKAGTPSRNLHRLRGVAAHTLDELQSALVQARRRHWR